MSLLPAETIVARLTSSMARSLYQVVKFSSSSITDGSRSSMPKKPRADPTAKRPHRLCDPYGQGGKPLADAEVKYLCSTIHADWKVQTVAQNDDEPSRPLALTREFAHPDFLSGSRFLHTLAAVAQMNAHFPSLHLERKNVKNNNWQVVSVVRCHTTVLRGLSTHDFHLAMVRFRQCLTSSLFLFAFMPSPCYITSTLRPDALFHLAALVNFGSSSTSKWTDPSHKSFWFHEKTNSNHFAFLWGLTFASFYLFLRIHCGGRYGYVPDYIHILVYRV